MTPCEADWVVTRSEKKRGQIPINSSRDKAVKKGVIGKRGGSPGNVHQCGMYAPLNM